MEYKDNEVIGLKTIIVKYLLHWKLFLGVFLFSFIPAIAYLICYPRTYEMMARIQIQEDKELGGGGFGLGEAAGLMKSFGLGGGGGVINIEDELMTLTSNKLLRDMVLELGINVEYFKPFTLGYRLYDDVPYKMTADSLSNANLEEDVEFTVRKSGDKINIKAENKRIGKMNFEFSSLPATIELPMGQFTLSYVEGKENLANDKYNIVYHPAGWVAEDLSEELMIEEYSKSSNVIELGCTDYEKRRGVDMLNTLIALYNMRADEYKKSEARKTIAFLDGRIADIIKELSDVEGQIQRYKSKHQLMDVEHDVQFYVEQMKELQTKLIELQAQENVVGMMDAFVKDPANKYNLVPALLSAQEGEKGGTLTKYNEVLLERARVIQNSSINNPLVATLTKQADELRVSVFKTINNAQKGLELSIAEVRSKEKAIFDKMNNFPEAEKDYVDLKRQQEIVQGVYLILLQKREETALVLGHAREKAKIVDSAFVKSKPIGPRKLYAAIAMLFLTLVVPVVYLFVKEQYYSLKDEFIRIKE